MEDLNALNMEHAYNIWRISHKKDENSPLLNISSPRKNALTYNLVTTLTGGQMNLDGVSK